MQFVMDLDISKIIIYYIFNDSFRLTECILFVFNILTYNFSDVQHIISVNNRKINSNPPKNIFIHERFAHFENYIKHVSLHVFVTNRNNVDYIFILFTRNPSKNVIQK